MLSRIISILFAVVAGAAALIGFGRGSESLRLGRNNLTPDTTKTSAARQVGQNAVTVSPPATTPATVPAATTATASKTDPIANSTFIVSSETETTTTTGTSTDAAIAADPTPGARPPAPVTSTTTTAPAPSAPVATTQPTAPVAAPPTQPVRAMW